MSAASVQLTARLSASVSGRQSKRRSLHRVSARRGQQLHSPLKVIMPQWSVAEWRARIGGSWLAIGRPFKTKSSHSRGAGWVLRVLTMNQFVTMTIMMIMLIGTNLVLRVLVNRGYHLRLIIDLLRFGPLSSWNLYLLNSGYLVTVFVSTLYHFLPFDIKNSLSCDFKHDFHLISQLLLSVVDPLISPLLWLTKFVGNELVWMSAVHVSVVWISLANYQVSAKLEASCNACKDKLVNELSKRGEVLRRLSLAGALLDMVLSVAVHVIIFKLVLSGDVEKNPGPGQLDYNTVDASTTLDRGDLSDIMEEIISIRSQYYAIGRSLRLEARDLKALREAYPSESDSAQALEDVLLLWLDQKYDAERYGHPTWRMLVVAVDKETGGNSHELAKKIADGHLAGHQSRHATEANRAGGMEQREKDFLGINDTREIIDMLWDYRAKWKFIGIELQIEPGDLDAIRKNNRDVEDALYEMIKFWLYRANPRPTRTVLEVALQSRLLVTEDISTPEDSPSTAEGNWCCLDFRRILVYRRIRRGHAQKIANYAQYLKTLFKATTLANSSNDQWPPPCTDSVFRLAMIRNEKMRRGCTDDAAVREKTISGKVDDVLQRMDLIELEDIFKVKKQQGEGKGQQEEVKKVLMEGAPGSGKSTLSFHMCCQWTEGYLFQEYKLVILVRLRETTNVKSLADLLPRRNDKMGREIVDLITASDGDNVLFILDGWDELPPHAPAYSFMIELVKGTKLPKSSIIITSRPTSSAILHSIVHLQIEILGFTKDELQQYFKKCLQNSAEAAERLIQRIKQNPIVEGTCYLPLNASILVHLFKCGGNVLPTTQYGIFTELVCTCIFRHLKKTHQDINELKSLDELPSATAAQFKHLCKVAYDGVMQDIVIFDLGSNFNTLGLLQGVESLAVRGKSYSYNFLHLSIQELLCAIYMADELDENEQTKQFKQLFGQPRFMLVFQFFAAKTKLKTAGISEVVTQVARKCSVDKPSTEDKTLLVSLMHCLFEAQDSSLCQLVADELDQKLTLGTWKNGIRLNPTDCYYLGYFLTFCKGFEVFLAACSIGDDHCKSLFRKEEVYNLRSLSLHNNFIGDKGVMALAVAMKTAIALQWLGLWDNSIGAEGRAAIEDAAREADTKLIL